MKIRLIVLIALLVTLVDSAQSQSFYASRRQRSLIMLAGTGTSTYFGELKNPGDFIDAKPNLTVGLQYYFTEIFGARAEATWFQLAGSDADAGDPVRIPRNLSFTSDNFEISMTGLVNLFPNGQRFYQRPGFNAYGFAGIGLIYYNPKTEYQGTKYALRPLKTELVAYSSYGVVVPMGLGVRFKLGPMFNVSLEGGYRKTFTDYLDDVSTVHYDASRFSDPIALALSDRRPEIGRERAAEGAIRGNPETKDGYMLANIKLEYYLPVNFLFKEKSLYTKKRKSIYSKRKKSAYRRRR